MDRVIIRHVVSSRPWREDVWRDALEVVRRQARWEAWMYAPGERTEDGAASGDGLLTVRGEVLGVWVWFVGAPGPLSDKRVTGWAESLAHELYSRVTRGGPAQSHPDVRTREEVDRG